MSEFTTKVKNLDVLVYYDQSEKLMEHDNALKILAERYSGEFIGAGTNLLSEKNQRDIQFRFKHQVHLESFVKALTIENLRAVTSPDAITIRRNGVSYTMSIDQWVELAKKVCCNGS